VVKGSVREVFLAFLYLGLTCFGGPIAHFAYFRQQFVERRGWVTDRQFGQLLTLCQFLPGPGSSKLGFALGLLRAGWPGAIAAFVAFTAPSALLLFAFAALLPMLSGAIGQAALHGLKVVAVSVVAYGLIGMTRTLCPDFVRRVIAIAAAASVLSLGQSWAQPLVVALAAGCGAVACRGVHPDFEGEFAVPFGPSTAWLLLAVFALLLVCLPLAAHAHAGLLRYAEAFFRTGALAFGGGHVVLPLLQDAVVKPGWVSSADFLAGYGAAQAVPGPMFALSAYLGARLPGSDGGLLGASVALVATFLPGFLLAAGMLPLWRALALHPVAARSVAGVCAALVGMLAAALYDPLWVGAIRVPGDVFIAAVGFLMLIRWRASALLVVFLCVALSILLTLI